MTFCTLLKDMISESQGEIKLICYWLTFNSLDCCWCTVVDPSSRWDAFIDQIHSLRSTSCLMTVNWKVDLSFKCNKGKTTSRLHAMSFVNSYHVKVAVKCFIFWQLHAPFAFWHVRSWLKIIMASILIRSLINHKEVQKWHTEDQKKTDFSFKTVYDESFYIKTQTQCIWSWSMAGTYDGSC